MAAEQIWYDRTLLRCSIPRWITEWFTRPVWWGPPDPMIHSLRWNAWQKDPHMRVKFRRYGR